MKSMFETIKDKFPGELRDVLRREIGVMQKIDIDLSIVLTDQPYDIAGNYFYIWEAPSDTYLDIKVNQTNQQAIPYVEQTGQKTPFKRLYVTTPAGQAGTVTLLYGTEAPELLEMIDNRAALSADIATLLNELRGDATHESQAGVTVGVAAVAALAVNADRKGCWLHSLSTNTNSIFLAFTNAVTAGGAPGTWVIELQPGQAWGVDDYRGAIYAISGAANQYLGTGEW